MPAKYFLLGFIVFQFDLLVDPKAGEPTGERVDSATGLVLKFLPKESDADKLRDLKKA